VSATLTTKHDNSEYPHHTHSGLLQPPHVPLLPSRHMASGNSSPSFTRVYRGALASGFPEEFALAGRVVVDQTAVADGRRVGEVGTRGEKNEGQDAEDAHDRDCPFGESATSCRDSVRALLEACHVARSGSVAEARTSQRIPAALRQRHHVSHGGVCCRSGSRLQPPRRRNRTRLPDSQIRLRSLGPREGRGRCVGP